MRAVFEAGVLNAHFSTDFERLSRSIIRALMNGAYQSIICGGVRLFESVTFTHMRENHACNAALISQRSEVFGGALAERVFASNPLNATSETR